MIFIKLDRESPEPLYVQIFNRLAEKIMHGEIKNQAKLPSQREMASRLNVSVNTVTNAYEMLVQYGYVSSSERMGYFINETADDDGDMRKKLWRSNTPSIYNFSRNGVDLTQSQAVKKAYKTAFRKYQDDGFTYPDYNGSYDVRKQISIMLGKTVGISCDPTQIIIGSSTEQLLCSLLMVMGCELTVGIENPAYYKVVQPLKLMRQEIKYINIPTSGIDGETLGQVDADILFLMPFHHYPVYYTMTGDQKSAVLGWAGDDRLIIEYGYDMDFVYDEPTETLFSMSKNKNVAFLGNFKRSVAPSVNLSYVVLPEHIFSRWQKLYYTYHSAVSMFEQDFIAELIRSGGYYSNIKRLRGVYKSKLGIMRDSFLSHELGNRIKIMNDGCGSTMLIEPLSSASEEDLIVTAHQNGVKLSYEKNALEAPSLIMPLNTYIMGCGELSGDDIKNGVKLLLDSWRPLLTGE